MSSTTAPITVYSTPSCVQCQMTYKALERSGLDYDVIDLAEEANSAAREWITEDLGYSQAPVVVVNDEDHWCGFRPDQIKRLVQATAH